MSSYRNTHKDSLIKKNTNINYYTTADDITHSLWKEMIKNEYEMGIYLDRKNFIQKLDEFYNAVRNNGPLDSKQKKAWQNSSLYIFNGELVDRDAPGNILYGYMGKVYGFSDAVLKGAAGVAQISAGTSECSWLLQSFGDDPMDQANLERGIEFYLSTHN